MGKRRVVRAVTTAAAVALLTTSCLSESGGGDGETGGTDPLAAGDKKVEILGAFGGDEAKAFEASLAPFEQSSGIDVTYTPSADFTTLIRSRVTANNLPDIGIFPQPGLLADIARTGKMRNLADVVDVDAIKADTVPGFVDSSVIDGVTYGAPMRMAVKSLVWYPVPEFEAAGYEVPTTQAELTALTEQIKADGKTPWCMGIESGPATGWPATDWLEEYMLRTAGPEVYDQWVSHEIPFNDPQVKTAAEAFENLVLAEGNVLGGRKAVAANAFGTAANPMFEADPQCFLHRQGNFIQTPGFFPTAVTSDIDANVATFPLPGEEAGEAPVLLGGDLAAVFNADADVKAVMEFISGTEFGAEWAKVGGWLSPRKGFDVSQYTNQVTRDIATSAFEASVGRYDASDVMPGAVGSGSFWTGMTAWISGQQDLDEALDTIEESWPTS